MFIHRGEAIECLIVVVARTGAILIHLLLFILFCTVATARASIYWLPLIFIIISPYACRVREEGRFIFQCSYTIAQSLSVLTDGALIAGVPSANRTHP
jgi:hypothetical protein